MKTVRTRLLEAIEDVSAKVWRGEIDLFWLVPLLVAVVYFSPDGFRVTADMAHYMRKGLEIYNGNGYVTTSGEQIVSRGPLFPTFIAIGYLLFDGTYYAPFVVVKSFSILNVMVVYYLGRHFYSRHVGFIASMVAASSPVINVLSLRHIDAVFAFFALLSVLVISMAFEKDQIKLYALAGVTLGATFLVKETALSFFPLPVLLWAVSRTRGQYRNRETAILYGALGVVLGPWIIHVYSISGSLWPLFGGSFDQVLMQLSGGDGGGIGLFAPLTLVGSFVNGAVNFHVEYVFSEFAIGLLFIPGWIYVTYLSINRQDRTCALLFAGVLLVPLLTFVVKAEFRSGQALSYYLLSFVAIAGILFAAVSGILDAGVDHFGSSDLSRETVLTIAVVVLMLVSVPVTNYSNSEIIDRPTIEPGSRLTESNVIDGLTGGETEITFSGKLGDNAARRAGQWLEEEADAGSSVLCIDPSDCHEVYLSSSGSVDTVSMPFVHTRYQDAGEYNLNGPSAKINHTDASNKHLLFLTAQKPSSTPKNRIRMLTQEDLLTRIETQDADYTLVTDRWGFMAEYFEAHPDFEEVSTSSDSSARIYVVEAEELEPITFTPRVSAITTSYAIRVDGTSEGQWLEETVLREYLGMNATEIQAIRAGPSGEYFVEASYW